MIMFESATRKSLLLDEKKKQFLAHLMGLRGIAILFVVLFHLRPDVFSQGFLGVDCFLVISGYLLFRGGREGVEEFKLLPFIYKKILRIIPLLAIVVIITALVVFPVFFSTKQIEDTGACGVSSMFCVSNFHYSYKYSNYFSTNANLNPLLHTWFLSMMVQIYAIWAIGCIILKKFNNIIRIAVVVITALASLAYFYSLPIHHFLSENDIFVWSQTRPPSYYDTFGRLWQVSAGALICILPRAKKQWINIITASIGVMLLFYTLLQTTDNPYGGPLCAVVATILILAYLPTTKIRLLLENPVTMWVGKISFSLYLIHFPILVIYKRYTKELPDFLAAAVLLFIIVIAGWLLWKWVEKRKFSFAMIALLFVIAAITGTCMRFHQKFGVKFFTNSEIQYPIYAIPVMPDSIHQHLLKGYDASIMISDGGVTVLHQNDHRIAPGEQAEFLPIGNMNQLPEFVVVGDSNAQQMYAGYNELSKSKNISGVYLSSVIFPFTDSYIDASRSYSWNKKKYKAFIDWLKAHPEIHTIVVGLHWQSSLKPHTITTWEQKTQLRSLEENIEHTKQFCISMQQINKQVVFVSHTPILLGFSDAKEVDQCLEYARWRKFRYGTAMPLSEKDPVILTQELHSKEYKNIDNVLYALEKEGFCTVINLHESAFSNGSILLYSGTRLNFRDRGHITPPLGIELLAPHAEKIVEIIKQGRRKFN